MSTKTEVILSCDLCGSEDLVSTHEVGVDTLKVVIEVCDKDWRKATKPLETLFSAGRAPQRPRKNGKKRNLAGAASRT